MDGAFSKNISLAITFFNFKKAFDAIDRDMMFALLQHYGIPDEIVAAIRVLYDQSQVRFTCKDSYQYHLLLPQECYKAMNKNHFYSLSWDYVSKRSTVDFGYLTHKGNNQANSGRRVRSNTRLPD